jgi:hypothetical protein
MIAFDLLMLLTLPLLLIAGVWLLQQPFLKVGYVPSPPKTIDVMIRMAQLMPGHTVLDLGAGDGRVLLAALKAAPGIRAIGCEVGLLPWALGKLRCHGKSVQLRLQSLFHAPVAEADVIFLYLFPSMMEEVLSFLRREAKTGTLVVCHSFGLPGLTPLEECKVMIGRHPHTIRSYRLP